MKKKRWSRDKDFIPGVDTVEDFERYDWEKDEDTSSINDDEVDEDGFIKGSSLIQENMTAFI